MVRHIHIHMDDAAGGSGYGPGQNPASHRVHGVLKRAGFKKVGVEHAGSRYGGGYVTHYAHPSDPTGSKNAIQVHSGEYSKRGLWTHNLGASGEGYGPRSLSRHIASHPAFANR